jgi:hypothetical protein
MNNPLKPKTSLAMTSPLDRKPGRGVADTVELLLEVLARHEAEPNEGMLSLIAAFTQTSRRVLDTSAPEDAEHNREGLLDMVDEARRAIETWSVAETGWRVH